MAEKETVQLKSVDGKIITAELLEKGKDKVKLKIGRKTYILPFTKLSEESTEIVKKANIPTICDFRLVGDFTKRGKKISKDRKVPYIDFEGRKQFRTMTDSYRLDTISGKVTVKNLDMKDSSPKAQLYVVVLCSFNNDKQVIRREVIELKAIERGKESNFDVGIAQIWHTERGDILEKPKGLVEGRYSGYIAAVVIDGRIVEVKSVPSNYERDLDAVRKFLKIGKVRLENGKPQVKK